MRIFGEGISRADVEHAVSVVERSMARPPQPRDEGRVTCSRFRDSHARSVGQDVGHFACSFHPALAPSIWV